ncbi:unnamed protein product [Closterium sp. NIES-53]
MLTATNHWALQCLVGDGYRLMFQGVDPRDGVTLWLLKRCRTREFDEFHAESTQKGVDPRDGVTLWLLKCCRTREFEEFQAEVRGGGAGEGGRRVSIWRAERGGVVGRRGGRCKRQRLHWRAVVSAAAAGHSDRGGARAGVSAQLWHHADFCVDSKFNSHSLSSPPRRLHWRAVVPAAAAGHSDRDGTWVGLEYLHSFGIMHRCLCVRSIFLDGNRQIAGFDYVTTRRAAASGEQHAVVGVRGYVDPHLLLTQEHTTINDLYR